MAPSPPVKGITQLPNGKFRVRIYRSGTPFHGGYYDELQTALLALEKLRHDTLYPTKSPEELLLDWFLYKRPRFF